ncbi:nitroreductase family protein [Desulforamulus aeronauticus]|uniref:Nitroreductase n=1 Tax=Desulforamulus aeronauticus DSM 10349 TaxID=1121421 RepID=A0A1M6Q0G6_9FIRM|nr:nitroreductase family protein [Desulforamulus aeronauticus]SHK13653.1 Nitroreductase [Desulforamulus aeronauticus DSM 10349]
MDFLELAKQRYSVRKFTHKKVEQEKVDLILEAGRVAPTAVNYQPQRILVLDSEDSLNKMRDCTPYRFHETLAILICYDQTVSWKRKYDGKDSGDIDASIVATHMMLEATNLGLGSTWVGHFDPTAIREKFALPESIVPVAILLLGYPHEEATPHAFHNARFEKSKTVFYNVFPSVD